MLTISTAYDLYCLRFLLNIVDCKHSKLHELHTQKRTTCNKSANKLLQVCSQAVNKMSSHCLFPVVETSL